jgi:hypothetical protein
MKPENEREREREREREKEREKERKREKETERNLLELNRQFRVSLNHTCRGQMLQSKREIHEMSQFSQTEHKIC